MTTVTRRAAPLLLLLLACAAPAQTSRPSTGGQEPQAATKRLEQQDRQDEDLQRAVQDAGTVIITATRHDERLFTLPYHAAVRDRDVLGRSRTVQDALREVPGVHIQRTSYGQVSPFLRGFTGYHTLMLVDGIRLNNSVLRSGPNEYWGLVDGQSLDRVEAVFGPGSVIYGSDAVGGTVNAIPLRRTEYGPEDSWDRRLFLRYSSAEQSIVGRAQVSGNIGEDFGFVVGGTGGAFSDLEAGGDVGPQPATDYWNWYADGRFDFRIDDQWALGLLVQVGRIEDVNRVHRTVDGISFHGTSVGSDRSRVFDWSRDLVALFVDGTDLDLGGFIDEAHVRLSWQRIEEQQDRRRGDGRRNFSEWEADTFGFALELTSETSIGRLTYGVDWYHDEVDSSRVDTSAAGVQTVRIQGAVGDDSSYDLVGVFLQDEVSLLEGLDLVLGGRFTYASADAGRVQDPVGGGVISISDDWTSIVSSARLLYELAPEVNLYAGVSQAFRAPNLSDISRLDSARSGELEVASTGLDPEQFINFEIGGKVQWEGLTAEAAYHYTIIDDLIIRQPTGNTIAGEAEVVKRNGGDGHVQGIDLRARYDFDENWFAFGSFQWLDGQSETFPTSAPFKENEALSRLPPISGTLGGGWRTADGRFMVRAWALMVDKQGRLNARDRRDTSRIPPGGTPGYTIFNVEASYLIDPQKRVFLSVENISDKDYRTHGSGVQEPGVNLVVGADITF